MVYIYQKTTIVRLRRPRKEGLNELLQWFGEAFGLFGERDKERSCFRIFINLLKAARQNRGLTSDELAHHLDLSRGTVVHHLNRLMESGLVIHEQNRYFLRSSTLHAVVEEIQADLVRTCETLKTIADDIDEELGL